MTPDLKVFVTLPHPQTSNTALNRQMTLKMSYKCWIPAPRRFEWCNEKLCSLKAAEKQRMQGSKSKPALGFIALGLIVTPFSHKIATDVENLQAFASFVEFIVCGSIHKMFRYEIYQCLCCSSEVLLLQSLWTSSTNNSTGRNTHFILQETMNAITSCAHTHPCVVAGMWPSYMSQTEGVFLQNNLQLNIRSDPRLFK